MLELDGLFKNALSTRAEQLRKAEEACGGSNKETAAATNIETAGDETDTEVWQRENMQRATGEHEGKAGTGKR